MAREIISLGTGPDTSGSESTYAAFDKANRMFGEVYDSLAAGGGGTGDLTLAGLNAAPIVRRTRRLDLTSGLALGYGVSSAQRVANRAALQAAVDAAVSAKENVEMADVVVEIEGEPLTLYGSRMNYVFNPNSLIRGCTLNQPAVRLQGYNDERTFFYGIRGGFGVDQTGQNGGHAIEITGAWNRSVFEMFMAAGEYGPTLGNRPYNAVRVGGEHFFSNHCRNWNLVGPTNSYLWVDTGNATGNVWDNIYCNCYNNGAIAACARPVVFGPGTNSYYDTTIRQLNIEWTYAPLFLEFGNVKSWTLDSLHMEQCHVTGAWGGYIRSRGRVALRGVMLLHCRVHTDLGATDGAALFWGEEWTQSVLDSVKWENNEGHNNLPVVLFAVPTGGIRNVHIDARTILAENTGTQMRVTDTDPLMGTGQTWSRVDRVQVDDVWGSRFEGGAIWLSAATLTHYGAQDEVVYFCSGPGSGGSTYTLANTMLPSGGGKPKAGSRCAFKIVDWDNAGTGNMVIKNHNGTTLATVGPTDHAWRRFSYDGTNWVLI